MTRIAVQTAARAGAQKLLDDYAASAGLALSTYRARPAQLHPPQAWIESIGEVLVPFTREERQRTARVTVRIVWGLYDSGAAVDQRDAFIDGFLDWVCDHDDEFGPNTDVNAVAVADDPAFSASGWIPNDDNTYFSSEITLEGFAAT